MAFTENPNRSEIRCPAILQKILLALLSLHFLGVLSEPLRFFSRSEVRTGPEFIWLGECLKPYSQWLYINHGYFFFAPNPGPSHLIECTWDDQAMSKEPEGSFVPTDKLLLPDRREHWPRLLYHRYFMLSEFYHSRFVPAQVTEEAKKDLEFMRGWAFDKELYDQIGASVITSLKHSRHKERFKLRRLERALPDSQQVLKEGWTIDDPRLIAVLPETIPEAAVVNPVDELPSKSNPGQSP